MEAEGVPDLDSKEKPDYGQHPEEDRPTKVEEGLAEDAANFEEEPEEELGYDFEQEETPFPRTFEAGTNHVEVVLPHGRSERVIGTGLRSLRSYVDQFQQGLPLGTELVVDVDDQPAMDYDLLQLPPHGSPACRIPWDPPATRCHSGSNART